LKSHKRFLQTLLSFLIAALFIFLAFKGIQFESLLHDALRANFLILIAATIVALFSLFLRSLRWRVILQEIKPKISTADTFGSLMVGYMLNNFVPRLGEIVRAYTTGKIEETRASAVLGTIVIERLFDMLSAGILAGIALATYGEKIIGTFPYLRYAGIILIVFSVAIGVVFYVVTTVKAANNLLMRFIRFVTPKRFSQKVEGITNSFLSSFLMLHSPRRLVMVTFYTILVWGVYFFQIYIPFFAFGSTSLLTFYDAFILGMVATVSWLIPSPGALGVYHLFVSQALTKLFGVVQDEALAYATLTHLFGYITITVVGAVFAFTFTRRLKIRSVGKLIEAGEESE
jgi:uncharacterized protein (TIRG00374 family)